MTTMTIAHPDGANATWTGTGATGIMMRRVPAEGRASPSAAATHTMMTLTTARGGADEPPAPSVADIARTAIAETTIAEKTIAETMMTRVDGGGGLNGGIGTMSIASGADTKHETLRHSSWRGLVGSKSDDAARRRIADDLRRDGDTRLCAALVRIGVD
jgi:hypothetical protein